MSTDRKIGSSGTPAFEAHGSAGLGTKHDNLLVMAPRRQGTDLEKYWGPDQPTVSTVIIDVSSHRQRATEGAQQKYAQIWGGRNLARLQSTTANASSASRSTYRIELITTTRTRNEHISAQYQPLQGPQKSGTGATTVAPGTSSNRENYG